MTGRIKPSFFGSALRVALLGACLVIMPALCQTPQSYLIGIVAGGGGNANLGDGKLATGAQLDNPNGVAVDGAGNLYIADTFNNRVRKVAAATGIITTVAGNGQGRGEFGGSSGPVVGDGGPATSTQIVAWAVAVDGAGNLFIVDNVNDVVRKVAAATGIITTVAGSNFGGYSGDGGPATSAEITPFAVAVDGSGNLYISEASNHIRKVAAATGIITTIAGNGIEALLGR